MSDSARSIVLIIEECHTRIQTVSELLLLSCTPRPVFSRTEDLAQTKESFVRYRDKVIGQLNKMLILSRDIATQVHSKQIHWRPFCQRIQELSTTVIHMSELTAHIAYLMAINSSHSQPATPGPVSNIHQLTQADLDIRFSCTKLKRSRMTDLQPHLLVDLCGTLTKALTIMTDICRHAAEKMADSLDQDQFKLCIKAINSTTGCLVSSIKSFKRAPSETHLRRLVTFCDPVTTTSAALLNFATEEGFLGQPAQLSSEGTERYKSVLGLCMSMASANIQICRAVRDLVYASSTKRHQDRMSLCVESVTRTSSQLRDLLLSFEFVPKSLPDLKATGDSGVKVGADGLDTSNSNICQEPNATEVHVDTSRDNCQIALNKDTDENQTSATSSVEGDVVKVQNDKEAELSETKEENSNKSDITQVDSPTDSLADKDVSASAVLLPESSSSSRPISLSADPSSNAMAVPIGSDISPLALSPQILLSSPLSISSTSLASSVTSSSVAPELLELAEGKESILALETLSKSDSETAENVEEDGSGQTEESQNL